MQADDLELQKRKEEGSYGLLSRILKEGRGTLLKLVSIKVCPLEIDLNATLLGGHV